jgi:DNA-binding response OmpR family regulator
MQAPLSISMPGFPARDPARGPAGRVFICDDDLAFAEELAAGLSGCGLDVVTLAGGRPLTDIFENFQPDIVLLDIFMPPPDGFEVMNQARAASRRDDIVWVLMSGAGTSLLDVAARFCVARNMRLAATLQKPLNLAEIARLCAVHAPGP